MLHIYVYVCTHYNRQIYTVQQPCKQPLYRNKNNSQPSAIFDQFSDVATYFLVCLTISDQAMLEGSLCLIPTTVIIVNMLCCSEINKLGGMFTLWYMVFPPILFIS